MDEKLFDVVTTKYTYFTWFNKQIYFEMLS